MAALEALLRDVVEVCAIPLSTGREDRRARFPDDGGLGLETQAIGSRPAGGIDADHPLLRHLREAASETGLPEAEETASSTDASVPMASGIPARCVGAGHGEDVHKRTEELAIEGLAEGCATLRSAVRRIAADPRFTGRGAP